MNTAKPFQILVMEQAPLTPDELMIKKLVRFEDKEEANGRVHRQLN